MTEKRKPLPIGTLISYCGHEAVVVEDYGGSRITVACEGVTQRWYWEFEGVQCEVVKLGSEKVTNLGVRGRAKFWLIKNFPEHDEGHVNVLVTLLKQQDKLTRHACAEILNQPTAPEDMLDPDDVDRIQSLIINCKGGLK